MLVHYEAPANWVTFFAQIEPLPRQARANEFRSSLLAPVRVKVVAAWIV
jgi:hypothetical protein